MKIRTGKLLQSLLCVSAGLSKSNVAQSDCFIFRKGRVYTMNREIACSCPCGLSEEVHCAVQADRLMKFMKLTPDEEADITLESNALKLKCGTTRKTSFSLEDGVLLPVEAVELPQSETWQKLDENYSEAVTLTAECTVRKENFIRECIHIHPKMLEACDGQRALRFGIKNFVDKSVLARGKSLKSITQLGMTSGAETVNWLHFKNPMGLRVSVRKHELDKPYMNLNPIINSSGRKIRFPKKLAEAAARAGTLAGDKIRMTLTKNGINIHGKDIPGEHLEDVECKYLGPDVSFTIHPKLLEELALKDSVCEVTEKCLKISTEKYTYCTSLEEEK